MCVLLFVSKREGFVVIRAHFIKITDHLSIMSAQNTIMKHALMPDKTGQYYHKKWNDIWKTPTIFSCENDFVILKLKKKKKNLI